MASGVARRAVSCPLVAPLPAPLCAPHSHRRARQHPGGRNITYAFFAGDENRSHRYAASASTIAAVTPLLGSRRRRKDGAWGTGGKSNDTCSCDIGPGGRWGELGWGEKRGGAAMTTLLVRAKEAKFRASSESGAPERACLRGLQVVGVPPVWIIPGTPNLTNCVLIIPSIQSLGFRCPPLPPRHAGSLRRLLLDRGQRWSTVDG